MLVDAGRDECVVFVHGTFGRQSTWSMSGSEAVAAIEGQLAPYMDVARFEWSGRNNQSARRRASVDLARLIRSPPLRSFKALHLIGHSHGGNVASRAGYLSASRVASISNLATPYLRLQYRDADSISAIFGYGALVLYLVLLASCLLADAEMTVGWFIPMLLPNEDAIGVIFPLWLATIFLFAPLTLKVFCEHIAEKLHGSMHEKIVRKYQYFSKCRSPTLSVFYRFDEAFFAIRTGLTFRSSLSGAFDGAKSILAPALIASAAIFIFPLLVFGMGGGGKLAEIFFAGLGLAVLGLVAANMVVPVFNSFTPLWSTLLALGIDTLFDNVIAKVRVDQELSGHQAVNRPIEGPNAPAAARSWLRHCRICRDPQAIDMCVKWVSAHAHARDLSRRPSFKDRPPIPRNPLVRLASSNDYPDEALANGEEGRVSLLLHVDSEGGVERCDVVRSSGFESLDRATVEIFTERAKFVPASDGQGHPVEGSFEITIHWRIQEEEVD